MADAVGESIGACVGFGNTLNVTLGLCFALYSLARGVIVGFGVGIGVALAVCVALADGFVHYVELAHDLGISHNDVYVIILADVLADRVLYAVVVADGFLLSVVFADDIFYALVLAVGVGYALVLAIVVVDALVLADIVVDAIVLADSINLTNCAPVFAFAVGVAGRVRECVSDRVTKRVA